MSVAQVSGQSQNVTCGAIIAYGATLQSAYRIEVAQSVDPQPLARFQTQGDTF